MAESEMERGKRISVRQILQKQTKIPKDRCLLWHYMSVNFRSDADQTKFMFISSKKLFLQSTLAKKKGLKASYLPANFDVLLKPPLSVEMGEQENWKVSRKCWARHDTHIKEGSLNEVALDQK